MKIAIVTDIHIGVRGDSKVFHEVQRKFFEEEFFPYLDEHGITTVFDLGDTFDRRKYINYATLSAGKSFLFDNLVKRNIDFHCLIGNHDTYYASTNEINSMNLLTREYPQFTLYEDDATELEIGSTKFLMLPWLNKENGEKNLEVVRNTDATILMGHLEVKGFEMMKGALCMHGIDMNVFKNFESAFSGHFHHPSRYGNVEYLGSPYEMTWSDYKGSRGFHVFDTETREIIKIENPNRVFYKVFYDDETWTVDDVANYDVEQYRDKFVKVIVQNRTNAYLYDMFMGRMSECGAVDVRAVDDHLNLDAEGVDEILDETKDTTEILSQYIDGLETTIDKGKVKTVLDDLYHEAMSL